MEDHSLMTTIGNSLLRKAHVLNSFCPQWASFSYGCSGARKGGDIDTQYTNIGVKTKMTKLSWRLVPAADLGTFGRKMGSRLLTNGYRSLVPNGSFLIAGTSENGSEFDKNVSK
jgi:hypothetical protein